MKRLILLGLVLGLGFGLPGFPQAGDADGDGLDLDAESLLGTDPANPDTDGDGLPDGEEYVERFTDPTTSDSDGDGVPDGADAFPTWLDYTDLNGVTTSTDRLLRGPGGGLTLNQLVEVAVGNVITIDWYNHLTPEFTMASADFVISFDFIDPEREDFSADGFYRVNDSGDRVEVLLPATDEVVDETTAWRAGTMTISDWPYHMHGKPLEVGQSWDYHVFYHEFLAQGEDPYFTARSEVVGRETLTVETRLGRRAYETFKVETRLGHVTFNDPFFKSFLGPDPVLRASAWFTVERGVVLRYTTPFFRVRPSSQVGTSDFIVDH